MEFKYYCAFSLDSSLFEPDSEEFLPKEAKENGWVESLDKNSIEDLVENATSQPGQRSTEDLLKAFIFFYENDAFIEFT